MSMKRVLAAFMGVTLMAGNGPVSVMAADVAAESSAETAIVNLETQGRTNPIGVDAQQPAFPGRCSRERLAQPEILPDRSTGSGRKCSMGFRCSGKQ